MKVVEIEVRKERTEWREGGQFDLDFIETVCTSSLLKQLYYTYDLILKIYLCKYKLIIINYHFRLIII